MAHIIARLFLNFILLAAAWRSIAVAAILTGHGKSSKESRHVTHIAGQDKCQNVHFVVR